jgi:putative MATE family efflux protein
MASTGTVGLVAIFAVDFLSLLYISWLGDARLTAGVGLATVVLFLTVSINVGLMIAVGALVSKALGAHDRARARRLAGSSMVHMAATSAAVSVILLPFLPGLLRLLGASDETLPVALHFLWIVLPTNVLMALGMGLSSVLRAVGDARRAMYVTLSAAVATAVLDPLFIFGLGLGPNGAAMVVGLSRIIFVLVGYHGAARIHRLVARPRLPDVIADAKPMFAIALPAILTNVAAPIANAFFVSVIAPFGDEVIAATAVIDRIVPVAFGGLFALSGAIGPILAQNWGALRFDRMRMALRDAALVMTVYVCVVWLLLAVLREPVALVFNAEGATADLVQFFCLIGGFMWFFVGLLFVSNASFNNLGFPLYSTAFNWARATLGMAPFAYVGAQLGGPEGALVGISAGSIPFGIAAIVTAFGTIRRLERKAESPDVYAGRGMAEAR